MFDYSESWSDVSTPSAPSYEGPASQSHLSTIIARIEDAIDTETRLIKTDVNFDLKASNAGKSRHLYDLNRALRGAMPGAIGAEERDGIARLRTKLALNEKVLQAHLNAVTEVAGIVQQAIEQHEADGTYSSNAFGRAS